VKGRGDEREGVILYSRNGALHVEFTAATENLSLRMRPVAIIDSDVSLTEEIRSAVEPAGFAIESFCEPQTALESLRRRPYSLAILGLDLRDTDPYAVCREASEFVPVITVAREAVAEICAYALECGADDCVRRGIAGRELVARIRGVLRRTGESDNSTDGDDAFSVSLSEMRVRADGRVHDLTLGEADVLGLLLTHAPAPLTTLRMSELLHVPRATIESRLKGLRRKVGSARIANRGAFGYQLIDVPRP
jgi:DNA-binding response OmpR family regulator